MGGGGLSPGFIPGGGGGRAPLALQWSRLEFLQRLPEEKWLTSRHAARNRELFSEHPLQINRLVPRGLPFLLLRVQSLSRWASAGGVSSARSITSFANLLPELIGGRGAGAQDGSRCLSFSTAFARGLKRAPPHTHTHSMSANRTEEQLWGLFLLKRWGMGRGFPRPRGHPQPPRLFPAGLQPSVTPNGEVAPTGVLSPG